MRLSKSNLLKQNKGLVHVYTGDGKGKTTCALGLALRIMGWGGRVCVVQFIKGYLEIGEAKFSEAYPYQFTLKQFEIDSTRGITESEVAERKDSADRALRYALGVVFGGEYDLVILDEINNAMHYKLISVEDVMDLIAKKPAGTELVLTGRNAPEKIVQTADYVTVMQMEKHPYKKNIGARPGIDY